MVTAFSCGPACWNQSPIRAPMATPRTARSPPMGSTQISERAKPSASCSQMSSDSQAYSAPSRSSPCTATDGDSSCGTVSTSYSRLNIALAAVSKRSARSVPQARKPTSAVWGRTSKPPECLLLGDGRQGDHLDAEVEAHDPNPGGDPPLLRDAPGLHPDDLAVAGDEEHLVARPHDVGAGDEAPLARQLGRDDALAAPVLGGVVLEIRPLAVAAVG